MINLSTKTGDQGQSGLANGQRLAKSASVFEVLGTLDELNSWLGLVVVELKDSNLTDKTAEHLAFLENFQMVIFKISAIVAKAKKIQLDAQVLTDLENLSETTQHQLADDWHQKFLMPGGTRIGAYLDLARTVCRRAERNLVTLNAEQKVEPLILAMINRFSDYLYVLRCWVNSQLEYDEKEFKN